MNILAIILTSMIYTGGFLVYLAFVITTFVLVMKLADKIDSCALFLVGVFICLSLDVSIVMIVKQLLK